MIRCQLPAYSPLAPGKLIGAAVRATLSPEHARTELARLLGDRYQASATLLTDSGTHALQTALAIATAAEPWRGRPVALPAYSCYDVVTAAVGADVQVVFYDIEPASLVPEPESVRRALAAGAGVLVANSLYAFPLDWSWLREECDAAGALLVEDAAQGLGSGWAGRESGSFGDLTVLSFGRGKGWTGGGGGALLARPGFLDAAGADRTLGSLERGAGGLTGNMRAFGVSLAQWALGRPWLYGIPSSIPALALGETVYKEPTPAGAMPPLPAAAALAVAELARREVPARRAAAAAWAAALAAPARELPGVGSIPLPIEAGACGYLRLPVLAPDARTRATLVRSGRALGLAPGYPKPLPELAAVADRRSGPDHRTPGANVLAAQLYTLPAHSRVSEMDRRRVVELLLKSAE